MKNWYGFNSGNLSALIEESGLSYGEIEDAAGIPKKSLSRYVHGFLEPNIKNAVLLAEYFKVSVDCIIGRVDLDVARKASAVDMDELVLGEKLKLLGLVEAMKYRRDKAIVEFGKMLDKANEICEMLEA